MNLSNTIRLLYAMGDSHQYCSTQFDLPADIVARVKALGRKIPDSELAGLRREDAPHVTVKYGVKGNRVKALKTLQRLLALERPVTITLGKTAYFTANPHTEGADVVIVEIISPDLSRLNRLISGNIDSVATFAQYKGHIAIAYVKAGLGKKYAGDPTLLGTKVTFRTLYLSSRDHEMTAIPLGGVAVNASYQIRRINNEAGFQGPDLYQVVDENGQQVGEPSRDEAGALLLRDKLMRDSSGLGKRPKSLKQAEDLLYGRTIIQDNRLRRTTGGTGGTGGPGNG